MSKEMCTLCKGLEFFMKAGGGQMAICSSSGEGQILVFERVSELSKSTEDNIC